MMKRHVAPACHLAMLLLALSPSHASAALVEEVMEVPVKVRSLYRQEFEPTIKVTVFRESERAKSPFLLLNHGRPPSVADMAKPPRYRYAELSRYFVSLGFAVLVPTRVGYGELGGPDVEDSGHCSAKFYEPAYANAVSESIAVLEAASKLSFMDMSRGVAVGQSFGGATAIALAASAPPSVKGTINFAGGGGGNPETRPANPCSPQRLKALFADYGKSAKVATLWLYSENDRYWGADLPKEWFAAFQASGGHGKFVSLPAYKDNGHGIFTGNPAAWQPAFEAFIHEIGF